MEPTNNLNNPHNLTYAPRGDDKDQRLLIQPNPDGVESRPRVLELRRQGEPVGWMVFIGNRVITLRPGDVIPE